MIRPTITLGGTNKNVLLDAHLEARGKLIEARKALGEINPNGRDYPNPADFEQAQQHHIMHVRALDAIIDEIYDVMMHIDEQQ